MFDFGLYTQVSDSGPQDPLVNVYEPNILEKTSGARLRSVFPSLAIQSRLVCHYLDTEWALEGRVLVY